MASKDGEQVLYTDESTKLVRKGDVYLPDKHTSPLDTLGLDLEEGEVLGAGHFFKVAWVFSRKRNRHYALKIFCKLGAPDFVRKIFFPREIIILKKLFHEHVLGVHEVLLTNRKGYFLMDFMPNGDLLTYINKQEHGHLSEPEARHLFHQLKSAVTYLHELDIVHRDIKCSNLLLDADFKLKLCDFGLATTCSPGEKLTEACGSMGYVAPEILEGDPYDGKPTDIWSMGVTLYAMLSGRLPYHEDSLDIMLDSIYNPQEKLCFPKTVSQDGRAFVHALLTPDPAKRVKLCDLAKLDWFSRPIVTLHSLTTSVPPTMSGSTKTRCETRSAPPSNASLDSASRSSSEGHRPSVAFNTDVEHGFSESQHTAGKKDKDDMTVVSGVLKAVAIRHAFGESPMSTHKGLGAPIGHGPHHFAQDTIGLKGPASRRISVQLSRANPKPAQRRASLAAPRRASLAPRKPCWQAQATESRADFTPSRKESLLKMTTQSALAPSLRRGSIALHGGKLHSGGSMVNLSSADLTSLTNRLEEKKREHELHDLHHTVGSKLAHKAGVRRHSRAETVRRNSVFTEDMKMRGLPNALDPADQEMVNSFRSKCEQMKHLVA
ncbi:uncharacterized protein [Diadema antillarum]|uniref:uncharacterized protein n=1 Tax=Diadema antillarum TaxID=105358 RepID=UPI003A8BAB06